MPSSVINCVLEMYLKYILFFRAGYCTFFGGRNLLLRLRRAAGCLVLGGRCLPAPLEPALGVSVDGVLHISQGMLPVEENKIN